MLVAEDTQKSNISVYVGQNPHRETTIPYIYQIDFINWYLEDSKCGTYALISPTTAFDMVQNGKGSLVYLNEKEGDTIRPYEPIDVASFNVYDLYIAYYDSTAEQKYLQPIYIISGEAVFTNGHKGQFYFYVPAINYDVIVDAPPIQTGNGSTTQSQQ
jgi:hypothetical protein